MGLWKERKKKSLPCPDESRSCFAALVISNTERWGRRGWERRRERERERETPDLTVWHIYFKGRRVKPHRGSGAIL